MIEKNVDILNKKLQKLTDEILEEAKLVLEDYKKSPSELSGSVIQVHYDSPLIKTREERLLIVKKDDSE